MPGEFHGQRSLACYSPWVAKSQAQQKALRVPWAARRSNQSILKEINLEYSMEKTLMLGKIEGKRRSEQQRMRWLDRFTDSMDMNMSKLQDIVKDRGA